VLLSKSAECRCLNVSKVIIEYPSVSIHSLVDRRVPERITIEAGRGRDHWAVERMTEGCKARLNWNEVAHVDSSMGNARRTVRDVVIIAYVIG
jgi:hypothetical protein